VEDHVDLPEGAEVRLQIVDDGDDLDAADRARLHDEIALSRAEAAQGDTLSVEEAMAQLRASRR
jgi:hypothetical protein